MPTYFVLCRQVLIGIVKIDRMCRCVPFNDGAWSRVRDHFGDQFVRCTFVGPVECSQLEMIAHGRKSVFSGGRSGALPLGEDFWSEGRSTARRRLAEQPVAAAN